MRNRLKSILFLSIMVPCIVLFVILFSYTSSYYKREYNQSINDQLNVLCNSINTDVDSYIDKSNYVAFNSYVKSKLLDDYSGDLYKLAEFYQTLDFMLQCMQPYGNNSSWLIIYPFNSSLKEGKYINDINRIKSKKVYEKIINLSESDILWNDMGSTNTQETQSEVQKYISFFRKLRFNSKDVGILEIRVPLTVFSESISKSNINNTKTVIVTIDDNLVYSFNKKDKSFDLHSKYTAFNYVVHSKVLLNCFNVSILEDKQEFWKGALLRLSAVFALFILTIIIVLIFSKIKSITFTKGINNFIALLNIQDNVQLKSLDIYSNSDFDELKTIKKSFMDILLQLEAKYDQIVTLEQEKNELNVELLQSKINPHMLYNSLSVIKWNALRTGNSDMVKLISYMVQYYRGVLGDNDIIVTVKQEVELLETFVRIYEYSRKTAFRVEKYIDDDVLNVYTLKLIMQPFIENAILHGISKQKEGTIIIRGYRKDNRINIEISDNGCGMEQSKISEILDNRFHPQYGGFGIINTIKRIKAYYGDDSVVDIKSKISVGTTVTICFSEKANKIAANLEK